MTVIWKNHSGTLQQQPTVRELRHAEFARRAAAEGIVLLKNEALLPLKISECIALLGSGACMTVKGGIGSGDVNNRESISIYQGLKEAGITITSEKWLENYQNCYRKARTIWKERILREAGKVENPFDAYSANPFVLPEGQEICEKDIMGATAAVYVISRISGEGKDRRKEEGDYYLSFREQEDLLYLDERKIPTVLVINAGGPVELTDILQETDNIRAILNMSQLGQEGGRAVADVLLGKAVPSGKLSTTWAKRYEDYPSAESFGYLDGNLETENYREGVYIGYRYFDSFGIEPLFPFGYGLSYTAFKISFESLQILKTDIKVDVAVRNIGEKYAGKEVVQIYVTLPQTGNAKEYRRLAGFAKTKLLHPQESQKLSIVIPQKQLAGFSQENRGWIIEAGEYGILIGNGTVFPKLSAVIQVSEESMIEQTHLLYHKKTINEELGMSEYAKKNADRLIKEAKEQKIPVFSFLPHEEESKTVCIQPAEEQPVLDLIPLLYGNITEGTSNLGSSGTRVPGSAGETTEALEEKYGIRSLIMADGPAGLRLRQSYEVDKETDKIYGTGVLGSLENGFLEPAVKHKNADTYYQYCTAFPVGTALAQTWNLDLMEEFGRAIAAEMEELHIDLWLGPGMNIQRNPLCGRNFEYYSEDPLLSGMMAAAVTLGVQHNKKCGVTLKHFACNNQEDNRMGVDVRISEKAFREIYLRGFEIAVKQSHPVALMSSYNKINGVQSANNYKLCTVVAREEWGFEGVIMSDWNTTVPEDGSISWKCAAAGNDIIMPGNPQDAEDILRAYENGELSETAIRKAAGRILSVIYKM